MIEQYGPQFQAHLERISDFLMPSEGVVEVHSFRYKVMDGHAEPDYKQQGSMLMHFRSTSMPGIEMYLQKQ